MLRKLWLLICLLLALAASAYAEGGLTARTQGQYAAYDTNVFIITVPVDGTA